MTRKATLWIIPILGCLSACGSPLQEGGPLNRNTSSIIEIVKAGGGVTISGRERSTRSLKDIARAAQSSGAQIVITGVGDYSNRSLKEIAREAPGQIRFED